MDTDTMLRRAYAAWFRTGGVDQPNRNGSRVVESEGLWYAVLEVAGGYVVYRITNEGQLRRMKRPPKTLLGGL